MACPCMPIAALLQHCPALHAAACRWEGLSSWQCRQTCVHESWQWTLNTTIWRAAGARGHGGEAEERAADAAGAHAAGRAADAAAGALRARCAPHTCWRFSGNC
jgi:hypothetical protein